jgi:hypothetical protein
MPVPITAPLFNLELPKLTLRSDLATGATASATFGNWLKYLSEGVDLTANVT